MDKNGINSMDLRFLVKELRSSLVGGKVRKIYQYGNRSKQFLFEIFSSIKGSFWLYIDQNRIFISENKMVAPLEPPSFCMFLRKHLMANTIKSIRQHEFDRVIEMEFDGYKLMLEFVPPGNLILCDSAYNIIMPLEIQRWKSREIKPKTLYRFPPKVYNPFELGLDHILKLVRGSDKNLISFLSSGMGFGSVYAKEICHRARVDYNKPCNDVKLEEVIELHKMIRIIDTFDYKPIKYSDFISPFPLITLKDSLVKEGVTLSELIDEDFVEDVKENVEKEVKKESSVETQRVERIIQKQDESVDKWKRIEKDSREMAEGIYKNYGTVESVLGGIQKAKSFGMEWAEIKERVKNEQSAEAGVVKDIREGDGIIVLELDGKEVEIDIRKSVEENAAKYYEEAKWAKNKIERAGEAKVVKEEELKNIEDEPVKEEKELFTKKTVKKRSKWYEKFRWFFSSSGFLVVGGKDADQNEMLIKKYLDPQDVVFHADIPGAAFVIIKTQGLDVPEETKREAAEFAGANSKAWSRGLGTIDVYAVSPDQVSKTPPSGENMGKGSFMIYGEREWFRKIELKLSIGVRIDKETEEAEVVSGPLMAVRKKTEYFVTITPGFQKSLELSKKIKNKLLIKSRPEDKYYIEQIPLDSFQSIIPAGMGEIVQYG